MTGEEEKLRSHTQRHGINLIKQAGGTEMTSDFTSVLFARRRSAHDAGHRQLFVQAHVHGGEPGGLQVDGTREGVRERSHPLEAGRVGQEGVDFTLRLPDGAFGWVQILLAQGPCWVYTQQVCVEKEDIN